MAERQQSDMLQLFEEALREVAPHKSFAALSRDSYVADAGIDSLTFMQAVGVIEDRLGVRLADDEVSRVRTLGDMERLLAAKQAVER